MFVSNNENKRKRGQGWPIIKKLFYSQSLFALNLSIFCLFLYLSISRLHLVILSRLSRYRRLMEIQSIKYSETSFSQTF